MCKEIITDNSDGHGHELSSLRTQEKGCREIDTDITGSFDTKNVASANQTTNLPSVDMNRGLPGSTANSSQLSTSVDSSSLTSRTDAAIEKGLIEYPENENCMAAPASIQARSRASANCLLSPSEAMFILEADSLGLEGAYRMFSSFDPPATDYIEAMKKLPNRLRQIADDLEAILKSGQSSEQQ